MANHRLGGCCVAQKSDLIMLRYRPIAPKPPLPTPPPPPAITAASTSRSKRKFNSSTRPRKTRKPPAAAPPPAPEDKSIKDVAARSLVTVESVTDVWDVPDGDVAAAVERLASDECPAFVADEWGRVTWTNGAYRGVGEGGDVAVGLVTRGMVPPACGAFTCRVHVRHEGRGRVTSLAAPCDVWRVGGGRWAWRIDVRAALSLGL